MALAVVFSNAEIVAIERGVSAYTAAAKADALRQISGRSFRPVERHDIGAEYDIYELDRTDESLLSDPDRFIDPKYVGYVVSNCKYVTSFVGQR